MRYDNRMLFLFLSLLAQPQPVQAQQILLPLFENQSNPGSDAIKITNFRVMIFPHLGAYSTPQGREASAASVTVSSASGCDVYAARLDGNQEWVKDGDIVEHTTRAVLNAKKLTHFATAAAFYECKGPFTVERVAPLKSFSYAGNFVVAKNTQGVQIINVVDPDTYIKGVVPSEVEATWPAEALKAQAVAARTYAWWSVVNSRKKIMNYDMDDTVMYQAYLGNYKRTTATDQASDLTAGLILKYNGAVIKSYFSADSGGYTEDAKSVFEEELGYCQANPEQYDVGKTNTAWTKTFSAASLQSLLLKAKLIPAGVAIAKVSVDAKSRTSSGRAGTVSITGTNGKIYGVKAPAFRYATQIRSTLFEVKMDGANAVLTGKGYGHGVGMAQIGALEYARQLNWTYDQILKFYYTGTVLTNE
jgi:SpoIID/LytB domain protein